MQLMHVIDVVMTCCVLNMKCVVFIFHLQSYLKESRYITIYKKIRLRCILMILRHLKHTENSIYFCGAIQFTVQVNKVLRKIN